MSLSDKSAVDVVGDLDVDDCATGSFCSSCAIPPRVDFGVECGVMEWGMMCSATTATMGVIVIES